MSDDNKKNIKGPERTSRSRRKMKIEDRLELIKKFKDEHPNEHIGTDTMYGKIHIGKMVIQLRSKVLNGFSYSPEIMEQIENLNILEQEREPRSKKIDRLLDFVKENPGLWQKYITSANDEISSIENDSKRKQTEDKYNQAREDYFYLRAMKNSLTPKEYQRLKDGGVGRIFGESSEIERISQNSGMPVEKLNELVAEFGSIENFRNQYIEAFLNPKKLAEDSKLKKYIIDFKKYLVISFDMDNANYCGFQDGYVELKGRAFGDPIFEFGTFINNSTLKGKIDRALSEIKDNTSEILKERYLEGEGRQSLDTLAEKHNCSSTRISQIELNGLTSMRLKINEHDGEEHLSELRRKEFAKVYFDNHDIFIDNQNSLGNDVRQKLRKIYEAGLDERKAEVDQLVEEIGLDQRELKILKSAGIETIDDLLSIKSVQELSRLSIYMTEESMNKIKNGLSNLGFEADWSEEIPVVGLDFLELSAFDISKLNGVGINSVNDLLKSSKRKLLDIERYGEKKVEALIGRVHDKGLVFEHEEVKNASEIRLDTLPFSERAKNIFQKNNINTVQEFLERGQEILGEKGIGEKTKANIIEVLNANDIEYPPKERLDEQSVNTLLNGTITELRRNYRTLKKKQVDCNQLREMILSRLREVDFDGLTKNKFFGMVKLIDENRDILGESDEVKQILSNVDSARKKFAEAEGPIV